jgi:hypothetical protein
VVRNHSCFGITLYWWRSFTPKIWNNLTRFVSGDPLRGDSCEYDYLWGWWGHGDALRSAGSHDVMGCQNPAATLSIFAIWIMPLSLWMRNFFAKLQLPNTPGLPPILRMFPDFLVPLKVREFSEPGSKVNRAFLCKFF